ncbi:hypothetical protein ACQCVH_22335 [Bacillus infantis]|uniref:hypothetical protein n=1 Tax=Bacillus infantis TaxID=324767 RepID=UPI003CE9EA64
MNFNLIEFKETIGYLVGAVVDPLFPILSLFVLLFIVIKVPNNLVKLGGGIGVVLYLTFGNYSEVFRPIINMIFN